MQQAPAGHMRDAKLGPAQKSFHVNQVSLRAQVILGGGIYGKVYHGGLSRHCLPAGAPFLGQSNRP
eukprot:scaffold177691_cov21-Tisochrysis_lutea.AAC.1